MEQAVRNRRIPCLCHFTRASNIRSIFRRGILPREIAEERINNLLVNDEDRYDGHKNANCLSIGYPNYKMFYKLQHDNPHEDWIVIKVKPEILWLGDCAFCKENAASHIVTCIPITRRKGRTAFLGLFENYPGKRSREDLHLPDYYPTNPQAEVLYFGVIRPSEIMSIHFKNRESCRAGRESLHRIRNRRSWIRLKYGESQFKPRIDWEEW